MAGMTGPSGMAAILAVLYAYLMCTVAAQHHADLNEYIMYIGHFICLTADLQGKACPPFSRQKYTSQGPAIIHVLR